MFQIGHPEVEFTRPPGGGRMRALHSLLRPLQHHPCAAESDGAKIKLAVFTQHAHHVAEAQLLDIERPFPIYGFDRNHWHQLSVLLHSFLLISLEHTRRRLCDQLLYVVETNDMRWGELELLEEIGLTGYERRALAVLLAQGVADAKTLKACIESPREYIKEETTNDNQSTNWW